MPPKAQATATKRCSTCAEDMRAEARKCTKCGSYQGIRRFLAGWGAAVSVLAAIISVLVAVAPRLSSMLVPKTAEPEISLIGAQPSILTLSVRNRGSQPIYVDGGGLDFGKGRSSHTRRLSMLQREVVGAPIEGKTTRKLTFLMDGGIGPFTTADSVCIIYLFYGGHSDQVQIASEHVSCVRLAGLNTPSTAASPATP